MTSQAKYV